MFKIFQDLLAVYLQEEDDEEKREEEFYNLLCQLATPPTVTTLRINTMHADIYTLVKKLKEELETVSSSSLQRLLAHLSCWLTKQGLLAHLNCWLTKQG